MLRQKPDSSNSSPYRHHCQPCAGDGVPHLGLADPFSSFWSQLPCRVLGEVPLTTYLSESLPFT